jgi:CheY-like chemotaxis protein
MRMKKILVIEDNMVVRQTLAQVLEAEGYQIVTAPDGRCGLSLYETEQPDLVITDLIMPEKEGIETIRSLLHQNPNAKIIAISGGARLGNTDILRMARSLGACDTLVKPFDPDDLVQMANRLVAAA